MSQATPFAAIPLPADLVAKLEEMQQYRAEDRDKPVQQLVQELCESYVAMREKARWAAEHQEEIERAYRETPDVWNDAKVWEEAYPSKQDAQDAQP
jgi:hypothetical protein